MSSESSKPVLTYWNGRGKAECIRLMLAATGVEWTDRYISEAEEFDQIKKDGKLMYGQLPLLEIEGKNLVQSNAITRYLARRGNLYGNSVDEALRIDLLYEGTRDFQAAYGSYGFSGWENVVNDARQKALPRYLPVYEQALKDNGSNGYLVGESLTYADIGLLEPLLWTEELLADELKSYPEVQKFLQTVKNNDRIKTYLNGPQRPRINDERYVTEVKRTLRW